MVPLATASLVRTRAEAPALALDLSVRKAQGTQGLTLTQLLWRECHIQGGQDAENIVKSCRVTLGCKGGPGVPTTTRVFDAHCHRCHWFWVLSYTSTSTDPRAHDHKAVCTHISTCTQVASVTSCSRWPIHRTMSLQPSLPSSVAFYNLVAWYLWSSYTCILCLKS